MVTKLNLGQYSEAGFGQDFNFRFSLDLKLEFGQYFAAVLYLVMKLNLGQYSEATFGQDFNFRFSQDTDVWLRFWG